MQHNSLLFGDIHLMLLNDIASKEKRYIPKYTFNVDVSFAHDTIHSNPRKHQDIDMN